MSRNARESDVGIHTRHHCVHFQTQTYHGTQSSIHAASQPASQHALHACMYACMHFTSQRHHETRKACMQMICAYAHMLSHGCSEYDSAKHLVGRSQTALQQSGALRQVS